MAVAADAAQFPSSHEEWPSSRRDSVVGSSINHLALSLPDFAMNSGRYIFASDIGRPESSIPVGQPLPDAAVPGVGGRPNDVDDALALQSFTAASMYPLNAPFTAMAQDDVKMQDAHTISPLQTRFDGDASTFDSNASFSADGSMHSATFPTFNQWPAAQERDQFSHKPEYDGQRKLRASTPNMAGQRDRSAKVEPGSARAVYLEKNRKAASKCRTKQKREQEALVETARDAERKNRALKAEVEFLKADMRDLMHLVRQHNNCPDGRLQQYVQREADRLAQGDQAPVAELLSMKSSSIEHDSAEHN